MNKKISNNSLLTITLFLSVILTACVSSGSYDTSSSSSGPERGWLCDYDKTGSIRLWTSASMSATVKDTVGTCLGCCVDVSMSEKKNVNGILFYLISVGGQSGWVDVAYYYPDWLEKPDWSNN